MKTMLRWKKTLLLKKDWKKTNPLRRVSEVRDRMFMCKGANWQVVSFYSLILPTALFST